MPCAEPDRPQTYMPHPLLHAHTLTLKRPHPRTCASLSSSPYTSKEKGGSRFMEKALDGRFKEPHAAYIQNSNQNTQAMPRWCWRCVCMCVCGCMWLQCTKHCIRPKTHWISRLHDLSLDLRCLANICRSRHVRSLSSERSVWTEHLRVLNSKPALEFGK